MSAGLFVLLLALLAGCSAPASEPRAIASGAVLSDADVATSMVGRWEGYIDTGNRPNLQRLLIIRSVSREDGRWIVRANYGLMSAVQPALIDVDMEVVGHSVILRFTTRANTRIVVSTTDGMTLRGEFRVNYDVKPRITFIKQPPRPPER